jgi:hypothetical protein
MVGDLSIFEVKSSELERATKETRPTTTHQMMISRLEKGIRATKDF